MADCLVCGREIPADEIQRILRDCVDDDLIKWMIAATAGLPRKEKLAVVICRSELSRVQHWDWFVQFINPLLDVGLLEADVEKREIRYGNVLVKWRVLEENMHYTLFDGDRKAAQEET